MFVPQFKFFKKSKKLKSKGFEFKTISLNYGAFGLKSLGNARVSIKNIETRITPKANRAVIFDGLRYHTGSVPTKNNRVLINMNFD